MERKDRIVEHFWLIVTAIIFTWGMYQFIKFGTSQLFVLSLITSLLAQNAIKSRELKEIRQKISQLEK